MSTLGVDSSLPLRWYLFAAALVSSYSLIDAQTSTIVFSSNCNETMEKADSRFVRSHRGSGSFRRNFDCQMTVQALKNDQMLYIRLVRPNYYGIIDPANTVESTDIGDETTCNSSYIQVFDGESTDDPVLLHTCGTTLAPSITTTQNFATFVMRTQSTARVNFTFLYTSFDYGPCEDEDTELLCNNMRCIPRTLACERINNCGDGSDELDGAPSNCTVVTASSLNYDDFWWWWIPVAALLLLYILYWCCWRPGYVPWRFSCCRNCWRDMCRDCCKHCCTDCACGKNGKGRRGQGGADGDGDGGSRDRKGCTCFSCCRSAETDTAYLVSEKGGGGKGDSGGDGGDKKKGRKKKKSQKNKKDGKNKDKDKKKRKDHDVVLIDEDGTTPNGYNGGIHGFDASNDDGQHARECR